MNKVIPILFLCLTLAACGSSSSKRAEPVSTSSGGYTSPRQSESVGVYKVGNPYWVMGVQYFPKEDTEYDEVGLASWYGSKFHGKRTANGEVFDMYQLSAAHKTLPMPIMVKVTNLENGKSVIARVNDRGPFVDDRIIDMSYKGAQMLDFVNQGTTKVRVEYYGPTVGAAAKPQVTQSDLPPLDPIPKASPATRTAFSDPPATVTGQNVYIQAGSFASAVNAEQLKANVSRFYTTNIREVTVNGRQFFRVHLGPFADVNEANVVYLQLQDAGFPGARIMFDQATQ